METEYIVGDLVLFQSTRPSSLISWVSEMDKYLGKFVTIETMYEDELYIKEDGCGFVFPINVIERKATKEDVDAYILKRGEEVRKMEVKYPKIVFTSERVKAIAEDIFGEERVDVETEINDSFSFIIRFPHFTITNSKNFQHEIHDLFVRFSISPNLDKLGRTIERKASISMEGRRGALTLREVDCGYRHSHLPTYRNVWDEFCMGSSAFRVALLEVESNLSEDAWTILFLGLPNYVKWESLEGGPHCSIRDISYKTRVNLNDVDRELKRIANGIPREVWEVTENGISVIPGHEALYDYFNKHSRIRNLRGYSTKEDVEKLLEKQTLAMEEEWKISPLKWKGSTLKCEIICEDEEGEGMLHLDGVVMDSYMSILKGMGKTFLKQKQYNDTRNEKREKIFGTCRIGE